MTGSAPTLLGTAVRAQSPLVRIGGADLPATLVPVLGAIRIERGIRQVGRAEMTFSDQGFQLLKQHAGLARPGTRVTLALGGSSSTPTVFSGEVTGLRVDRAGPSGEATSTTIVAEEPTHQLARVQQAKAYVNMALKPILADVISPLSTMITGLPEATLKHLLVAESPLLFLERLCDLYGVEWWYGVDDSKVHVEPPPSRAAAVDIDLTGDVAWLSVEGRDTGPGKVTVRSWDPASKREVSGTGTASDTVRPTATAFTGSATCGRDGEERAFHLRAPAVTAGDAARKHAEAVANRTVREKVELRLQTRGPDPRLVPRSSLRLVNAGPLSGEYPITSIIHLWDAAGSTRVVAGPRRPRGVAAAVRHLSGVCGNGSSSGSAGQVLVGVVTDICDPDGLGRVKVKLPTLGENVATWWARVLLAGAGADRGFVVPHRVDDEVVVAFEEGDPQRPVVLGAVHNGSDAPPADTVVEQGTVKAAGLTSGDGHVLVVQDGKDRAATGLRFTHAGGSEVVVMGDRIEVTAGSSVPITLTAGQASIVLDAQGNVKIKGTSVSIEGTGDVSVKGTNLTGKATAGLTLQGTTTALKAQATMTVESSGPTAVKGAVVQIN